jgi:hypothetical protein
MMVDELLREALAEEASALPEPPDRWSAIEAAAGDQARAQRVADRRRARRRTGGLSVLGVAAAVAALFLIVPALTRHPSHRVSVIPAGPGPSLTTLPSPSPTTGVTSPSTVPAPASTVPPGAGFAYQPLYPFATLQDANAWQASYRASGAQPWHLDAGQTAISFTGFLGYTDVTTAFKVTNDSTGAHVTVGFANPNGDPVNAAIVHLRRFGTGADAPWEVVGTDDSPNFSLTVPKYGATVTSPLKVGGAIVGVDESIRVQVLQGSSATPLGVFCCLPAGNSGLPWSATVSFHGATAPVLIVAASTGGHLASVERFTVTAVRTHSGTTPGL